MKNKIYRIFRRLKQFFIMLSICATLLSGPVAGNEVRKMLKSMNERNAIMRGINEAENEENSGDKLKRKSAPYK